MSLYRVEHSLVPLITLASLNDQKFTTKFEPVSFTGLPVLQNKPSNSLFKVFQDLSNEAAYVLLGNNIYEIEYNSLLTFKWGRYCLKTRAGW